nr:immunoglobulin heavy chain junction region [Macaca mulatta]MOW80222.1 immunoglobulin heavy chain junction region [Macaca mulatta]MOW80773.1 immunoglobulin heavy chain junction region [Macaca mulatta]MOW81000.1 immunoglobulin heavy chain junction region [Macaca mulatta]MOW81784.1 immunoglobulin heavy chain junction region [Macaca mulatta]
CARADYGNSLDYW